MGLSPDLAYREAQRRSHRLLGCFLSMAAWTKNLECVVLTRENLLPYLGVEQMRDKRLEWIAEDIKKYFPYKFVTVSHPSNTHSDLFLARKPIPTRARLGIMKTSERIQILGDLGMRTAVIRIPNEARIISIMARVVHGIAPFKAS